MKLSKNFYLLFGVLFAINFIYSLFDQRDTHKLFFWNVNIWVYRWSRFLITIVFVKLYFNQKSLDSKKLN